MAKPALGRGLQALLGPAAAAAEKPAPAPRGGGGGEIPLERIDLNPQQVRKRFDEAGLRQLADTISQYGVLEPVLVQRKGDRYQLIAGERRFRAAKLAGLKAIPAVVKEMVPAKEQALVALIENIQRVDLNPMEEARGYQDLVEKYGFTHEQAAERVGKSRSAVTNALRLLALPAPVQRALADDTLSAGHARALAGLRTPAEQLRLLRAIVARGLSVRQVEDLLRAAESGQPAGEKKKKDPDVAALEEELSYIFGSTTAVQSRRGRGFIRIPFRSLEDLDRLLALFRRLKAKK